MSSPKSCYRVIEGTRDWCPIYRIFLFYESGRSHVLTTYSLRQALERCDLLNSALNRLTPSNP